MFLRSLTLAAPLVSTGLFAERHGRGFHRPLTGSARLGGSGVGRVTGEAGSLTRQNRCKRRKLTARAGRVALERRLVDTVLDGDIPLRVRAGRVRITCLHGTISTTRSVCIDQYDVLLGTGSLSLGNRS